MARTIIISGRVEDDGADWGLSIRSQDGRSRYIDDLLDKYLGETVTIILEEPKKKSVPLVERLLGLARYMNPANRAWAPT